MEAYFDKEVHHSLLPHVGCPLMRPVPGIVACIHLPRDLHFYAGYLLNFRKLLENFHYQEAEQ